MRKGGEVSDVVTQKIARLEAEIASLKAAQHAQPERRAHNIVEEPSVTVTIGDSMRGSELPGEAEVDQLLALVERAGQMPKIESALDRSDFRRSFVAALRFLANVGRLENAVNEKISAHDWALEGERYMAELGRSVSLANGALWAAAVACGVPWQRGDQPRGVPARLGLVWDSGAARAHLRWRQVLKQGKPQPPIEVRLDPLSRAQV
jgi:hypothetical protein